MTTILEFDYNTKGMNGSGGLMRRHWSKSRKEKEKIVWDIISQGFNRHEGRVKVTYTRRSPKMMDWDNLASTFKWFSDSMVKCGVIRDDSPKIIPSPPDYRQEKGRAWTQIKIEDIE